VVEVKVHSPWDAEALRNLGVTMTEFTMALDEINANPTDPKYDKPGFMPRGLTEKTAKIKGEDVESWGNFVPKHSNFLAIYYAITGLHGLHILGGLVMFVYFFFWGETIYRRNPEHQANRIEVVGLYWHFVDLVWIFVFPVFYLL
jgi:cytochrome c oxidase subunit 3